jgi:hypothetical protein
LSAASVAAAAAGSGLDKRFVQQECLCWNRIYVLNRLLFWGSELLVDSDEDRVVVQFYRAVLKNEK